MVKDIHGSFDKKSGPVARYAAKQEIMSRGCGVHLEFRTLNVASHQLVYFFQTIFQMDAEHWLAQTSQTTCDLRDGRSHQGHSGSQSPATLRQPRKNLTMTKLK